MWEVWSYPDYFYTEGEGICLGVYETLAGAETYCAEQRRPLKIVRVDYPATEHTAAEVIAYLEDNWNWCEHRNLVEDVKRHFNGR